MKKIIILIITLAFALGNLQAQNAYYPLEKGKVWLYQYGKIFSTPANQKSKIEVLEDTKIIGGRTYFMMQTSMGNGQEFSVINTSYARISNDGSIQGLEDAESTEEAMMFPTESIAVGTSWTVVSDGQPTSSVVIDKEGRIITPKKAYDNCLVIEITSGDSKIRSYFKKGLGMVANTLLVNQEEKLMLYLDEQ